VLKKSLMLLFTVCIFVLSACQDEQLILTDNNKSKYREIAWNAVETEQRKHVVLNSTEADVYTFVLYRTSSCR
jgi:protein involved in sex pheromone biosynthesis